MPPPYHRTQLATPLVLVQCSSTRRSIHISDIPTRPAHGPMVCRTPAPLAPPPFSKLARYALQMRLFVGQSGTTLDRRGPPSGCCHSFPSGQFWLRETRVEGWWLKFNERLAPLWPGSGSGSRSPLRRLAIADLLNLMQPSNASGG
jgi:hypothetical protein